MDLCDGDCACLDSVVSIFSKPSSFSCQYEELNYGDYKRNSQRLCARINNKKFEIKFNPTNPSAPNFDIPMPAIYTHYIDSNRTKLGKDKFNYEHQAIDITVKEGWSYVVWNFFNNYSSNVNQYDYFKVQMYMVNAD